MILRDDRPPNTEQREWMKRLHRIYFLMKNWTIYIRRVGSNNFIFRVHFVSSIFIISPHTRRMDYGCDPTETDRICNII